MDKRVERVKAPPPDDLEGWRRAISHGLSTFRIETVVAALQTLNSTGDRSVVNALAIHISDEMTRFLRGFIGSNHPNQGRDIIQRVHEKMIAELFEPDSADGGGLRTAFKKRLQFRATDAIQKQKQTLERYPSLDDPAQLVDIGDHGGASRLLEEHAHITRLLEIIPDQRKRRAFELHMEGCPLSPGKGTTSIAGELGVCAKTAGQWVYEVVALLKTKIGENHD